MQNKKKRAQVKTSAVPASILCQSDFAINALSGLLDAFLIRKSYTSVFTKSRLPFPQTVSELYPGFDRWPQGSGTRAGVVPVNPWAKDPLVLCVYDTDVRLQISQITKIFVCIKCYLAIYCKHLLWENGLIARRIITSLTSVWFMEWLEGLLGYALRVFVLCVR